MYISRVLHFILYFPRRDFNIDNIYKCPKLLSVLLTYHSTIVFQFSVTDDISD